jgi:hypothetical protein
MNYSLEACSCLLVYLNFQCHAINLEQIKSIKTNTFEDKLSCVAHICFEIFLLYQNNLAFLAETEAFIAEADFQSFKMFLSIHQSFESLFVLVRVPKKCCSI